MINRVELEGFTIFKNNVFDFIGPGLNVVIGKNSTGKSLLFKLLYSVIYVLHRKGEANKEELRNELAKKLKNVFMVDKIGRLTTRIQGNQRTKVTIKFSNGEVIFEFSTRHEKSVDITKLEVDRLQDAIFIPPKEVVSMLSRGFVSLYEDYQIMSEVYYDLAKKLEKPLPKGKKEGNISELLKVLQKSGLEHLNRIYVRNKEFYTYVAGVGNLESKLLAEGYRKLLMLIYLIKNKELKRGAYLFWDEPEVNLNPSLIKVIIEIMFLLSRKFRMQLFVATHDYFVLKYSDLIAKQNKYPIKFFSLYLNKKEELQVENAKELYELDHNAIIDEFEEIYNLDAQIIIKQGHN